MPVTNYTQQAQAQLNPAYAKQMNAYKSQLPAIQSKYNALSQGLVSQAGVATQGAFEDSNARGLLNSTIPVDLQTGIQQALIQGQGKLAGERAGEVAGINQQVAGLGVQRASAIATLINALRDRALKQAQFTQTRQLADRQFGLDQQFLGMGF